MNHAFHAMPAVKDIDPEAFATTENLKPKLATSGDGKHLVLNYAIATNPKGPVRNPRQVTVNRWTLDMPKSYALKWHEETVKVDAP